MTVREGSLEAPDRQPLDWKSEEFFDKDSLYNELERVYDICHGCRRCVSLCDSFPTLFDLVDEYASLGNLAAPLLNQLNRLDRKEPELHIPLQEYLRACHWVEQTFGEQSLRACGRRIGQRLAERLRAEGRVRSSDDPETWMRAMVDFSRRAIRDPLQRSWQVGEVSPGRLVMKRALPSNPHLNAGLLVGVLEGSAVLMPRVTLTESTRSGAPLCVYELRWFGSRMTSERPGRG